MRKSRSIVFVVLALLCVCAGPATQPGGLTPDSFDFKALLGEPPADGSDIQKAEITAMLALQENRTHDEAVRCEAEVQQSPFEFGVAIIGPWFTGKKMPATIALFNNVNKTAKVIAGTAKTNWHRNRPYVTDTRIKPCVELEDTFSYPSGHATRGILWAGILAELFPDKREALLAHGREYGTDRTLAGLHYPSDVAAGQKLGAEIARRMIADPQFSAAIAKAKEECAAAGK